MRDVLFLKHKLHARPHARTHTHRRCRYLEMGERSGIKVEIGLYEGHECRDFTNIYSSDIKEKTL
jgi:hypothetical protein